MRAKTKTKSSTEPKQLLLLLFDDNKIKVARKPGKKQKQNPVGCTREGKRPKRNIREG